MIKIVEFNDCLICILDYYFKILLCEGHGDLILIQIQKRLILLFFLLLLNLILTIYLKIFVCSEKKFTIF